MRGTCRVVGCRAGSPSDGMAASGYLITFCDGAILVDCGPGVVLSLLPHEIKMLKGVIITHEHADHMLDVMALAYHLCFPSPKQQIPLVAPKSVVNKLHEYDTLFGIASLPELARPIEQTFSLQSVEPGEDLSIAGHRFRTHGMIHPVETLAIRSDELSLAYTADGAYSEELVAFVRNCRCLISEATYETPDGHDLISHGHMTASECGMLAREAHVKELVITHLADHRSSDRTYDLVKASYDGIMTMAYAGLELYCH